MDGYDHRDGYGDEGIVVGRWWPPWSRPLVDPEEQFSPVAVLLHLLGWAMVLVFAVVLQGPESLHLLAVTGFAALAILGESLVMPVSPKVTVACGEVFGVVAFVVLPAHEAVWVVVVAAASVALMATSVHKTIWESGSVAAAYACGLLGVLAVRSLIELPPELALPVLVVAAIVGIRLSEIVWLGLIMFMVTGRQAGFRRRRGELVAYLRAFLDGEPHVQFLAMAPMALLGAYAYGVTPTSVGLLVVPYLVSWRSLRQAVRLADARRAAKTDVLTGLGNRAEFFERTEEEIALARRYRHSLALIMGDLDYFKRVNDSFGHLAGDAVLRSTAQALCASVDDGVFPVARYGGEEFVVVIPVLGHREVIELAERVRVAVKAALVEWGTTISLGVAYLGPDDRLESLIDRADKALYSAKYAGKDRVHEWRDELARPIAAAPASDAA